MLCSPGLQSSLSPVMEVYWPVLSLGPARPVLCQRAMMLQRRMQDLRSLEVMDKLQHIILEQRNRVPAASVTIQPVAHQLEKEGEESFSLTLDTKDFSPEELSVRTMGRKLRVSGKTEKKQEDGKGSYSYRRQEFRREFDLPEGVAPETVTCSLAQDGKLHIQAPKTLSAEEEERVVPVNASLEVETLSAEEEETVVPVNAGLEVKTQAAQHLGSQTEGSEENMD